MHITKLGGERQKVTNNKLLQIIKHEHWNKEWEKNFKERCLLKVFRVCVCLKPHILFSAI